MTTYRVEWVKAGTAESYWSLKSSGLEANQFRNKRDAVEEAKRLARTAGEKSKVIVERQSGSVQDTFEYSGNDPRGRGASTFGL